MEQAPHQFEAGIRGRWVRSQQSWSRFACRGILRGKEPDVGSPCSSRLHSGDALEGLRTNQAPQNGKVPVREPTGDSGRAVACWGYGNDSVQNGPFDILSLSSLFQETAN